MIEEILMISIGFILLIVGADLLVKGSSNIANRFHIPEILIGLTIIAMGTSMPELIITLSSAKKGLGDLIIGNAIGSNLCNILFILGLTAIIRPVTIEKEAKTVHIPIAIFANICILLMSLGYLGSEEAVISKNDGIVLIVFFVAYFTYPMLIEIDNIIRNYKENKKDKKSGVLKLLLSIMYIIIGITLLKYGGDFVVDNSTEIAKRCNVSERVIGLTIVAIGTALPELITSVIAAVKGNTDLAVGNLLGSCVLNLFFILGMGALIIPIEVSAEFYGNLILSIASLLIIWVFNFIGKKDTITRPKGAILLTIFAYYIIKLFV